MGSRAGEWARLVLVVSAFTALLWRVGIPSPSLFGGLCGALVVTVRGSELRLPPVAFRLAQATIGATVAAQIDPEVLRSLGGDWASVWTVIIATLVLSVAVGQLLRLHGVSLATATFASIAGGAAGMTALAHDSGADDRIVVVVQYFRVLVIMLTLPVLVTLVFAPHVAGVAAGVEHTSGVRDYAFSALAIACGLTLGRLARLPSPALLGTLLAGGIIGLLGFFDNVQVPEPVQYGGFLLIGVQAGLRFTRATLRLLAQMFPIVLIMVGLLIAGCGLLGIWLSDVTGESRLDGYLATSPGGLPVVLATVSETSGNVTFVSAVQLLRILLVLILAPIVAAVVMRFRRR